MGAESAPAFGGYYAAVIDEGDVWASYLPTDEPPEDEPSLERWPTLAEAKAACQRDYEARILSALQPAGELVEAARELRETATKVSDQLSDGGVTEAAHTELALALDRIATALKETDHV